MSVDHHARVGDGDAVAAAGQRVVASLQRQVVRQALALQPQTFLVMVMGVQQQAGLTGDLLIAWRGSWARHLGAAQR